MSLHLLPVWLASRRPLTRVFCLSFASLARDHFPPPLPVRLFFCLASYPCLLSPLCLSCTRPLPSASSFVSIPPVSTRSPCLRYVAMRSHSYTSTTRRQRVVNKLVVNNRVVNNRVVNKLFTNHSVGRVPGGSGSGGIWCSPLCQNRGQCQPA